MSEAASGDLGLMHLERGDFVQAMDILLKGGLWEDAAFIAERILSADELKGYVDKLPPAPVNAKPATDPGTSPVAGSDTSSPDDLNNKLRNLLGRRLVREDRYDEATKYLASPYDNGPWSTAQAAAYDDMHKAYGDGKTAEQTKSCIENSHR
jgi:hypothetical protein